MTGDFNFTAAAKEPRQNDRLTHPAPGLPGAAPATESRFPPGSLPRAGANGHGQGSVSARDSRPGPVVEIIAAGPDLPEIKPGYPGNADGPISFLLPLLAGSLLPALITGLYFLLALLFPPTVVVTLSKRPELDYTVPVNPALLYRLQVPVSLEIPALASGTIELPDGVASGRVRFISLADSARVFPAGTPVFQRGEVQYRLSTGLTVPGFSTYPGTAEGIIVADRPGPAGNGPAAGSFLLTPAIRVQGLTTLSGGTTRTALIFTAADLEELSRQLKSHLEDASAGALEKALPPGYRQLPAVTFSRLELSLPPAGSEYAGQTGRISAVATASAFDPARLLARYAPGETELTGPAIFRQLTSDLLLRYTRPVKASALSGWLQGWQGSPARYRALITYLSSLPEVTGLSAPELPPDFRALWVKVVLL